MWVPSYNVLDNIQASGADIVLQNHFLSIGSSPKMDFRKIEIVQTLPALNELLQIVTVTFTSADSTLFQLTINQVVNGRTQVFQVPYTTPASSNTATTIGDAMRSSINLMSGIGVVATGTATLILTAKTGSPSFSVVNAGIGTFTQATTVSGKTAFTGGTVVAATGVFTKTAHGFVVGDSMSITAATTSTFTLDGVAQTLPFIAVVNTVPSSSTFTLRGVVASADGTAIAASPVAQPYRGRGADLLAAGVLTATAGTNYYTYSFLYSDNNKILAGTVNEGHPKRHYLYVSQTATNFAAFDVAMISTQAAYNAGATTANPETLALA